jgi:zinc/manganese transport system substrate-binding protein
LLLLLPLVAYAKLNVVATLPGFGSLAREIGGDNVNVTVLAKPTEDPYCGGCASELRRCAAPIC